MDVILEALGTAIATLLEPATFPVLFAGSLLGLTFGAMPGLGGSIAMTLMFPVVWVMEPKLAMFFLTGIIGSVAFGGSISAILLNTPGTSMNAATALDGFPMTQKGEPGRALGMSATASLFGALFGIVILTALVPILREVVLKFKPPAFFMLTVFGLVVISTVVRGNVLKGLASAGVGLLISFMGYNPVTGTPRFTFGSDYLWDGITLIPFFVGIFAISQMLMLAGRKTITTSAVEVRGSIRGALRGAKEVFQHKRCFFQSAVIGTIIGIIPGVGGSVANWVSYMTAMQTSKSPADFGKGNPEGIIASEAANDAKDGGALVPTVAFGLPGSMEMAVLLAGFMLLGLPIGPAILLYHLDIVFAIILGMVISNIIVSTFGLAASLFFSKVATADLTYVIPGVAIVAFVGVFSMRGTVFDVLVALLFGFVGWSMRKAGFSIVALIIGFILGRLSEKYFLMSLAISRGSPAVFFTDPISLCFLLAAILVLALPLIRKPKKAGTPK